jgi:flagellar motor switch protein FliN/FliY
MSVNFMEERKMKEGVSLVSLSKMPVQISVVLGRCKMRLSDLLKIEVDSVIELDKNVDDLVEIFVNEKLIAKGEIVVVDNKIGITLKEIMDQ